VTPVQSTIVQLTGTASRAALRASLRDRLRRTQNPAATRKAAPPHFAVSGHKTSEYLPSATAWPILIVYSAVRQ
jgi:hypothetical protein